MSQSTAEQTSSSKRRPAKPNGSPKSRRRVVAITKRVLALVPARKYTPTEAAHVLGASINDVRNLRQGSKVSLIIFAKLVRVGRFTPESIINGPTLQKMRKGASVEGCSVEEIDARIHETSWELPGKELAKLTGLSDTGAYGLRYGKGHVALTTLLGFLDADYLLTYLVFGR